MPQSTFRPDIEGFRGIAILLVVFYHAHFPYLTGGFIGVDVFFVLSGYLITGLLVKESEEKGRIDFGNFYARRIRRLLPASIVTLVVTVFASFILLSPIEQSNLWQSALSVGVYVSNFFFAHDATNYLAGRADQNPFLHTWSLSVEEQFYLVFPFLVFLALGKKLNKKRLVNVLSLVVVISLALCFYFTLRNQPLAFFLSPFRAWEFAIGGLAAIFISTKFDRWLGWLGLAMVLVSAVIFNSQTVFPGLSALAPVVGTALALRSRNESLNKILSNPILQFTGRISYSWYLWHWSVLVLGRDADHKTILNTLICLVVGFGLAVFSYYFIENPIRYNKKFAVRPRYILLSVAIITVFSVGFATVWRLAVNHILATPEQIKIAEAENDYTPELYDKCFSLSSETILRNCSFGNEQSDKKIVLFGDSHAAVWTRALKSLSEQNDWNVQVLTKAACSPLNIVLDRQGRRYTECDEWRNKAIERIKELKPTVVIITTSQGTTLSGTDFEDQWYQGMKQTLGTLSQSTKVLYLRDVPFPGFNANLCVSRAKWIPALRSDNVCTFQKKRAFNEKVARAEQLALKELPEVRFIDLTDAICPGEICQPEQDETVIYRDGSHITDSFALKLAPALKEILQKELCQD